MDHLASILQWNCQSINNKKSDLLHLINVYKPVIIALQETWIKPNSIFNVSHYFPLREDRSDSYGGVALLVNDSVSFQHIPITHSVNMSIIAASINNICFVSLYIPHPTSSVYNELDTIISQLPKPIFIMGDFNAQHQAWGSAKSSCYGSRILDFSELNNFCILNTGLPTRRTLPHEGDSAPDLTICSPNLASTLTWSPLSSTFGSDHFPILIEFPSTMIKNQSRRPPRLKYKLNQNNDSDSDRWEMFREQVELKVSALPSIQENNRTQSAEAFASVLLEAADEVFPRKKTNGYVPSPPWWDSECTRAIKERKVAEINYKDISSSENYDKLIQIMNQIRSLFKKKKWEGWRTFCSSISPDISASEVWNNIRRFRSAFKVRVPKCIDEGVAEKLLDKLAPPFVPQELILSSSPQLPCRNSIEDLNNLNSPFTLTELKGVLSYVKDSAPGTDGIPYSFLTHLNDNSLIYLLNLINCVVMSGEVPPSWKIQEIIPILKFNKPSLDPNSYRPIALSSVLSKLAEHLAKNRLEWYVESQGLLAPSQYGFRKGKSTMDSLGIITTDIRLAFSNNEFLLAAFLDISAAYDNVDLQLLKDKLDKLQVPHLLSNFIINLLSERQIQIHFGDSKVKSRLTWKGLPQGSVLSPILYAIYTHDLEFSIAGNVNVLQYADDLAIYVSGRSIFKLTYLLNNALKLLKTWLDQNALSLSVSKSCAVLFTKMRSPPTFSIFFDGQLIPSENEFKFLGLILDSKLTGLPHCYYASARCERLLNILRCLSGVWWGAHPFNLRLLYNAIIRSILDYGAYFLEPCSLVAISKLDDIQSKSLRLIGGAMKSSPLNALQVECAEPPLKLRRQMLCDKFLFRAFQFSNHPLYSKLQELSGKIETSSFWTNKPPPCLVVSFRKFISLQAPTHRSQYLPLFSANYPALVLEPNVLFSLDCLKNDQNPDASLRHLIDSDWPDFHYLYCDASKHSGSGSVGIGVFHQQYNIHQKNKLPPETSVFTAECFGILKSLEYVLIAKLKKAIIFSDSKSALQSLQKFPFKSNLVSVYIIECRQLLLTCKENRYDILFAWIPGHHNIKGNEIADKLAKDAINSGDTFPFKNIVPDLISLPKEHLHVCWEDKWNTTSLTKGKAYKRIQQTVPLKPWFSKIQLSKFATSSLIRMRLGHVCTASHLTRIGICNNSLCACGAGDEDLNHIFFQCSLHDCSSFLDSLVSLRVPLPTSIPTLLSCINPHLFNLISKFLTENNIKL